MNIRLTSLAAVLLVAASAAVLSPAEVAAAAAPTAPAFGVASTDAVGDPTWEPAGNYEYTCTGVDGTAYSFSYADLPRCVGYVDVRINGSQIAHYSQTGQTASLSCTLGVGTSIVQIFAGSIYTGWGMAAWVWSSYLTGLGCKGS